MTSAILLLFLLGGLPKPGNDPPPLQAPRVTLRLDAPDAGGPWKMVVTNHGDVPVRLAADGRLLSLEVEPPEDADDDPYAGKKKKGRPATVICKLPAELRPSAVVESRAVVLEPGARYEEVISPALYCFGEAEAKALAPGAQVTAKFGFASPPQNARVKPEPRPPFAVEPDRRQSPVAAAKELVSERFIVPSLPPATFSNAAAVVDEASDPNGPSIELVAPARVDSTDERTVTMSLAIKNVGGRATSVHIRRDNLTFDVDGPNGSSHCGNPSVRRGVPRDLFETLAAGAAKKIDVWVGEMCPNMVFDRPGLYRVRASLAFPSAGGPDALRAWTHTVSSREPVLVRVRAGRLPFYVSPPQVFDAQVDSEARGGAKAPSTTGSLTP